MVDSRSVADTALFVLQYYHKSTLCINLPYVYHFEYNKYQPGIYARSYEDSLEEIPDVVKYLLHGL